MPAYSRQLRKDLDAGKIVLGGCCVSLLDPAWRCVDCEARVFRTSDVMAARNHFKKDAVQRRGFAGFVTMESLRQPKALDGMPRLSGVYLVLRIDERPPRFRAESASGHFKRRNPTVPASTLKRKWVDDTDVLYIRKAGGARSKATLRSRVRQYLRFGAGQPVGHWGGRYVWQLHDAEELLLCWKTTIGAEAREVERQLLEEFKSVFGKLPFANLAR